jgi:hypothetical protein
MATITLADALNTLKSMFPEFDDEVLRAVLDANGACWVFRARTRAAARCRRSGTWRVRRKAHGAGD